MRNVFTAAGDEIIQPDHLVPVCDQSVAEMGAEETGRAGDKNSHEHLVLFSLPVLPSRTGVPPMFAARTVCRRRT
jgi:hypothetical protein